MCTKTPCAPDIFPKCKGKMALKLPKAESTQNFSQPDDIGNLFGNFYPAEDGHTSANLLYASNVHRLSEKEIPLKLSEARSICCFSKSEDNYNLDPLFADFCSNKITQMMDTLPSTRIVQQLSESEDSYELKVLFEKEMPQRLSTAQSSHDISTSIDNHDFQVLLEDNGNGGKELDLLPAEITPEPHNLEDNLHGKLCTTNTTTQVTRFLIQDEYQKSSYRLDDRCSSNVDFNLSELSSSTRNVSPSKDSECGVGYGSERAIMCLNSADKHTIVPLVVHDTDKCEDYLHITTQSYEISTINKLITDITNSKEALSSLYGSMRNKMKEVELQEENSRKAKQDAAKAHEGFVTIVENYNKLIENSKVSNDKKAEMVHGEKSLLATLAQDLQSRLCKLSSERDDMLTIVEEIDSELDARLATSIEEETAAREHIHQKERLSLLVRTEKEAEMGSIMEESMKLQKEAEENILLRNLLTDCGLVIDMLQGQILSIHEKVAALTERTHRSKLQSGLVTTSSSATSSDMPECKTPSPDSDWHWQLENRDNSGILTQEKVGSHAKDHEGLSDDEWEMLETTQT